LNGHNSCGYNDIIPETKNEYDIETMVGSWFMNVIEGPTNEHITAPIKSTTAKYGMKNCPSFWGFILYPYTNITTLELKGIGHHQGMKMYHSTTRLRNMIVKICVC
jgi:hypothetical protein